MRGTAYSKSIRHSCNDDALCEAARGTDVRLDDVHSFAYEYLFEAEPRELRLAPSHRDWLSLLHLLISSEVFRRDRLLEPSDVVLLDTPTQTNGFQCVI